MQAVAAAALRNKEYAMTRAIGGRFEHRINDKCQHRDA